MKLFFFAFSLLAASMLNAQDVATTTSKSNPIYQLRIYEIFDNNKEAFHTRFRDHAMRIMKKYNFKISSIWESKTENKTEFVYLLEWPDEATMKKAWEQFRADKEWIDIKKQMSEKFGELVGKIEDRVLIKTDYSPNR
jgi:hypothetical protein